MITGEPKGGLAGTWACAGGVRRRGWPAQGRARGWYRCPVRAGTMGRQTLRATRSRMGGDRPGGGRAVNAAKRVP